MGSLTRFPTSTPLYVVYRGCGEKGACYSRLFIAVFMGVFCGGCSSYCGVDVQGRDTSG